MEELAAQYQDEDGFLWYITECLAAPRKSGKVVVKKTRPHPLIQVGAISSFITSRNQYASGDLGLPIGIWLFACQAHVDIKRVLCRLGYSVSDSTARNALNTLTDSSLNDLKSKTTSNDMIACWSTGWPGAFNADDHVARVIKQERQTMTVESIFSSIDWQYNHAATELHFVRVVADFSPHLHHLSPQISARFRTTLAKHRLPVHKTVLQPLPTNAEREVENKGMHNALLDFDQEMGIEPRKCDNILSWDRGDDASHATIMRLKKILATSLNVYDSMRNVISTPETWHTKATDLNSCASNHYGPAASKDPSSLSRSSNAANMKRPTDLKKCDFYPTSRSMTLIWDARVLDLWRIVLGCESDLLSHFDELAAQNLLPTLDDLLEQAAIIRERYTSQAAYDQFAVDSGDIPEDQAEESPDHDEPDADISQAAEPPKANPNRRDDEDGPKTHEELPEFDGDRVLSNAILFLMEYGWWTELNYAIPEGDTLIYGGYSMIEGMGSFPDDSDNSTSHFCLLLLRKSSYHVSFHALNPNPTASTEAVKGTENR
ncbi:hypothetical protein B0H13DRAFT_2300240 [Mycena leptocephala]|nr:hypothetical protein B0H13DRAFT_2300240 [Mycena leptocephala]